MAITDLIFYYIEISGFMSFPPKKKQKLILNTNRLTTIIGENLDIGDGERNGVGKSAIIDALLYLSFGKSPRVSNQGFLNYVDPGTMFVVGEACRNGIEFRVERGENPSVLRLFERPAGDTRDWRHKEDGKLVFEATKSTKPETSKRIVELIGFDLKLSDVLLVNNPSDKSCFYLKTEEDQRNIIERIFGFTVLTEKAENLRELRKEETKNLATKESALNATRLANDRVMKQITTLEEKSNLWAAEKDKLVKFLAQQIRSYEKVDFTHEIAVLTEVDELYKLVQNKEREISTHSQSLALAQKRVAQWETQHVEMIDEIKSAITRLSGVDAAAEIKTIRKKEALQTTIRDLTEKITAANHQIENCRNTIESEYTSRTHIQKQVEAIESQIIQLNESKCPTCGQDWADTKEHVVHSIDAMDAHNAEIETINTRTTELKEKYNTLISDKERLDRQLEKKQKELKELPPTTIKTVEEATRASTQLEQLIEKRDIEVTATNPHLQNIKELQGLVAACNKEIKKLQDTAVKKPQTQYKTLQEATEAKQNFNTASQQFKELKDAENPYRKTIDDLRTEVLQEIDETEIKALKTKIEHMSLLIKLLSDRDSPVRTDLLHDWLPELNDRINHYLEFLELPHRIVFDANMTATFTRNDKVLSFGNLSGGQRLRVWLATNRAFREIFELINYNINLFFVDEVLDKGMSARGSEVSYRLLEQIVEKNKSVFLITHRPELTDLADHTLTITLENGLSTIHG
jgi:DNA repair exonuclease SbcCD ATPase subunit